MLPTVQSGYTFIRRRINNSYQLFLTLLQKSKTTKKAEGKQEDDELPFEQSQITQAKRIMKPFVLRRLKRDVLQDLPKKTNHRELCPMSERQGILYKNLIASFSAKDGSVSVSFCFVEIRVVLAC